MMQIRMVEKIITILLFSTCLVDGIFAQNKVLAEYDTLLEDLKNINTFGYKGMITDYQPAFQYPYFEGQRIRTMNEENFAIQGKGFFKVYDKKNNRYLYTRCGMFIMSGNEYHTTDGFILITKIVPINEDLKEDDSTKISKYIGNLVFPTDETKFIRIGKYFLFTSEKVLQDQIILNKYLELSTVNVLRTLTRMIFILRSCKEKVDKRYFGDIETKLFILENLWKLTLTQESNKKVEATTYFFYDLSFPGAFHPRMISDDNIDWQRRTFYYYTILDVAPYLERTYF